MRSGPGAARARTILLFYIISAEPSKQPLMVRTFPRVYMELGSYFLFLGRTKKRHHHHRSKTCALQVHARQVLSKTCALSAECLGNLVHSHLDVRPPPHMTHVSSSSYDTQCLANLVHSSANVLLTCR